MEFLTTEQVGQALGVDRGTVIRWIKKGKIPGAINPGGKNLIPAIWLERYLIEASKAEQSLPDLKEGWKPKHFTK